MGQERQDAADPHRDRRSNRRHSAGGRGADDQRLDRNARKRGDEQFVAGGQRRRFAPKDRGRSNDRGALSAAEETRFEVGSARLLSRPAEAGRFDQQERSVRSGSKAVMQTSPELSSDPPSKHEFDPDG